MVKRITITIQGLDAANLMDVKHYSTDIINLVESIGKSEGTQLIGGGGIDMFVNINDNELIFTGYLTDGKED